MTGAHILIAAVIIVFVIAFIITMLVLNANAKKIISTNTKLVENQNTLLEQKKIQGSELEKQMSELEEQNSKLEEQKNELEEQKEIIATLQRQQEELTEQLKHRTLDEVMLLREQTRQHRENIELTAGMSDEELMTWIDQKMDETHLFTDSHLTLKTMSKALGLTQKRLGGLFRNHPKYNSLGDYLNERRHQDLWLYLDRRSVELHPHL